MFLWTTSTSILPQAPPSWCKPPSTPLLACRMAQGRGDLLLNALVVSPPPISRPFYPHSSHLVPTVHQDWPTEVGDVHPLLQLPVQGVRVGARGPHPICHVLPALVVMKRVEPENRSLFISSVEQILMLETSRESIPARLPFVGAHLHSTLVAPQIITYTFSLSFL